MRNILLFATPVLLVLYACKKEISAKSNANLPGISTFTVSASGSITKPIGVDLTGFLLLDMCSNEVGTTESGTVVFYGAADENFKALGIYNFAYRVRQTTIHRGDYSVRLERFTPFGEASKTYKLTLTPRSASTDKAVYALARINVKENGMLTIVLESGAIECR